VQYFSHLKMGRDWPVKPPIRTLMTGSLPLKHKSDIVQRRGGGSLGSQISQ
jgi:hypothetical protein